MEAFFDAVEQLLADSAPDPADAPPFWPLLQNFLLIQQLMQPADYVPPNPRFYNLLKSHSPFCIITDFLAYILSYPDLEGKVTQRVVMQLLDGTEFYSPNYNYSEAIRGFTHLFCDPTCFRNCACLRTQDI